jgi:uncharacterized membrane protein
MNGHGIMLSDKSRQGQRSLIAAAEIANKRSKIERNRSLVEKDEEVIELGSSQSGNPTSSQDCGS